MLLELFFLLHSPGILMLLQTWSYRRCLRGSRKGMNPSPKNSHCNVRQSPERSLFRKHTSKHRMYLKARCRAGWASEFGRTWRTKANWSKVPHNHLLYLCAGNYPAPTMCPTSFESTVLWKKQARCFLSQYSGRNREGNGATAWPINSLHLSILFTWELRVLIQEMEERASYWFESCLPSFF